MTFVRRAAVRRTGLVGCAALLILGAANVAQAEPRNPLKLPNAQYELQGDPAQQQAVARGTADDGGAP